MINTIKKTLCRYHRSFVLANVPVIVFGLSLIFAPAFAGAEVDLSKTPFEIVESTPKGEIVNPFDPTNPADAEAGHTVFMETSCNGCHGGTGGGGMGPALSNKVWVYGDDTDTLFRLITLGSEQLQARGYSRIGRERVAFPMPSQASGPIVIDSLTTERILRIITWIQSLHVGK